ncbi:hypothetical protein DNHGIG_40720 [Collibacillus ludicampi]|uniref:Uncharacterized protein n=1 Tax=Collibacillus ludicampi TaxID=2771369 RepID=A0AAV4LMA6_9BACL|nr:hypothetical protein [Collibacillus ludicampi]GIM48523.1 hypothetical protein DNHGIG_40720 [Collibacillus ludicampi]
MGKRGPKPTLTERDQRVLLDLYYTRCMTGEQLQISAFGSISRYAKTRIKTLKDRGLIHSKSYTPTLHDQTKSFPFKAGSLIYELTDAGVREAERLIGETIISQDHRPSERIKVPVTSVSRYLQTAEVFMKNKEKVRWIPYFSLRQRIGVNDFTIPCLAGVEKDQKIALVFGVVANPSLKAFSFIANNMKGLPSIVIKLLLMCPSNQTVDMAIDYYLGKYLEGDLHVMTYEQAQEDLPFLFGEGYIDVLRQRLETFHGHPLLILPATGRFPSDFKNMVEHRPGRFAYLVDLSTGNLNALYTLIRHDEQAERRDAQFNGSMRGIWVLLRDHDQFQSIKPYLSDHRHVRVTFRKAYGWIGCENGTWTHLRPMTEVLTK